MIKIILPVSVYLIVCIVAVLLPASDGYSTFGWKLFIAQIYAIPALIIAIVVSLFLTKRLSHR